MIKTIFYAGLFGLLTSNAYAACFVKTGTSCSPATSYEVEIQQVELCRSSSCANSVVVASADTTFDISSASAGSAVGEYANLDNVPAGVYTHVRTTISPTITFSAAATTACTTAVSDQETTFSSSVVTTSDLTTNSGFNITWNSGSSAFLHTHTLSDALAISKAGSLPQIQVDFATQEAALCISSTFYPGIPEISIRVIEN